MRMYAPSFTWYEACLWALLALAIIVRIMKLQLMEFKGDEFMFLMESFRDPFALSQIHAVRSIVPIPHPPMFAYLLALPTSLTVSPIAVTAYIVGLNLLGLWLLHAFCRQVLSKEIALATTTLVASMPWAIIFSRKIWNPDIVFPCEMLFLLALAMLLRSYRPWKLYLFALALAIFLQAHLLSMFSIIPLAAVFWFAKPHIEKTHLKRAGLFLFVLHIPYLAYCLTTDAPTFVGERMGSGLNIQLFIDNVLWWLNTSTGLGFSYLLGESGYDAFLKTFSLAWAEVVFRMYVLLGVVAYFWCISKTIDSLKRSGAEALAPYKLMMLFLLVWSVFLLVFLSASNVSSPPHYWVSLMVIIPFCVVLFLHSIARHVLPVFRHVVHGILLIVIATNIVFMLSFYSFLENHHEKITGDYGTPYMFERDSWNERLESAAGDELY